MTSLLLYFWLATSTGGSTASASGSSSGAAPTAPQVPAPPAAPTVKGPPVPAPPEFPAARHGSAPATDSSAKKRSETSEPVDIKGEDVDGKREGTKSLPKSRKSSVSTTQGRGVPAGPPLTSNALKNELRQAMSGQGDSGQPSERARLEQLAGEIAKAREALKQETDRLEELIRQRGSCDGELRAAAAAAATAGQGADAQAAKEAEREQMDSVSKAMKGMKPEQAAAVVTRLDHRLASEILRRMRPADAGAVLGFLRPELAAELATEIATRRPTISSKKGNP